jgi:predicted transcriptional regulator
MNAKRESVEDLKQLLEKAELPSAWAAKKLDISTGYWWRITSGVVDPSDKLLKRINSLRDALKKSKVLAG